MAWTNVKWVIPDGVQSGDVTVLCNPTGMLILSPGSAIDESRGSDRIMLYTTCIEAIIHMTFKAEKMYIEYYVLSYCGCFAVEEI